MVSMNFSGVIFSDPDLLVINKPSGLLSLPDGYHPDLPHVRSILEPEFGRLWIVHRLDKETSGVMILARSSSAHQFLNQQFQDRKVEKIYHAILQGRPDWNSIVIDSPLKINGDRRHRTTINLDRGKPACTQCNVLKRMERSTLISIRPTTGYTHQIRAHLASIGFPLLADPLYGSIPPKDEDFIRRAALHAIQIQINHPISNHLLELIAPFPADFLQYLNQNQPVE